MKKKRETRLKLYFIFVVTNVRLAFGNAHEACKTLERVVYSLAVVDRMRGNRTLSISRFLISTHYLAMRMRINCDSEGYEKLKKRFLLLHTILIADGTYNPPWILRQVLFQLCLNFLSLPHKSFFVQEACDVLNFLVLHETDTKRRLRYSFELARTLLFADPQNRAAKSSAINLLELVASATRNLRDVVLLIDSHSLLASAYLKSEILAERSKASRIARLFQNELSNYKAPRDRIEFMACILIMKFQFRQFGQNMEFLGVDMIEYWRRVDRVIVRSNRIDEIEKILRFLMCGVQNSIDSGNVDFSQYFLRGLQKIIKISTTSNASSVLNRALDDASGVLGVCIMQTGYSKWSQFLKDGEAAYRSACLDDGELIATSPFIKLAKQYNGHVDVEDQVQASDRFQLDTFNKYAGSEWESALNAVREIKSHTLRSELLRKCDETLPYKIIDKGAELTEFSSPSDLTLRALYFESKAISSVGERHYEFALNARFILAEMYSSEQLSFVEVRNLSRIIELIIQNPKLYECNAERLASVWSRVEEYLVSENDTLFISIAPGVIHFLALFEFRSLYSCASPKSELIELLRRIETYCSFRNERSQMLAEVDFLAREELIYQCAVSGEIGEAIYYLNKQALRARDHGSKSAMLHSADSLIDCQGELNLATVNSYHQVMREREERRNLRSDRIEKQAQALESSCDSQFDGKSEFIEEIDYFLRLLPENKAVAFIVSGVRDGLILLCQGGLSLAEADIIKLSRGKIDDLIRLHKCTISGLTTIVSDMAEVALAEKLDSESRFGKFLKASDNVSTLLYDTYDGIGRAVCSTKPEIDEVFSLGSTLFTHLPVGQSIVLHDKKNSLSPAGFLHDHKSKISVFLSPDHLMKSWHERTMKKTEARKLLYFAGEFNAMSRQIADQALEYGVTFEREQLNPSALELNVPTLMTIVLAHGFVSDRDPKFSGIKTDFGLMTINDIRESDWSCHETIILLSCETAGSKTAKMSDMQTVAAAFIDAGCKCVIAPIWSVRQKIAEEFISTFVELYFGKSQSTAEAYYSTLVRMSQPKLNKQEWSLEEHAAWFFSEQRKLDVYSAESSSGNWAAFQKFGDST